MADANFSNDALAFAGDAVYSLLVRERLCLGGKCRSKELHGLAAIQVCAAAQAKAYHALLPRLTEEEAAVLRRGKNSHCGEAPKNASRTEYQEATGLECLFGWLWLNGKEERARELFEQT
ncbi:MAG: ribonuclease III [Clostridium sp.]|nr:ribonuclease III [Clostridium sp.]